MPDSGTAVQKFCHLPGINEPVGVVHEPQENILFAFVDVLGLLVSGAYGKYAIDPSQSGAKALARFK